MRSNDRAGPQFHQVIDDDLIAGLQATEDDPILTLPIAGLHRTRRDLVLGIDDKDQITLGVLDHRRLRHQEYALPFTGQDTNPHELTG